MRLISLICTSQCFPTTTTMLELPISPTGMSVTVKAIDAGFVEMAASLFFVNPIFGPSFTGPIYTFLIEHPNGQKLMFDLGIRKDQEKLPPRVAESWRAAAELGPFQMRVDEDVSEQLTKGGVDLSSINAVIWRSVMFGGCRSAQH